MIYTCENCGFLFRRIGAVESCPYCDSDRIRPADKEEQKLLEQRLAEEKRGAVKVG